MSQYKHSMDRLLNSSSSQSQSSESIQPTFSGGQVPFEAVFNEKKVFFNTKATISEVVSVFQAYAGEIRAGVCLIWIAMFVLFMDRVSVLENVHITLLGILAACLANSVPIGGGVVYVPALALLGAEMSLGVSFSVSTMTVGNGIFGFLVWVNKDPEMIIWGSFLFSVVPCSIGSIIGILMLPRWGDSSLRTFFSFFCVSLAILVLFGAYKGGVEKIDFTFNAGLGKKRDDVVLAPRPVGVVLPPSGSDSVIDRLAGEVNEDAEEESKSPVPFSTSSSSSSATTSSTSTSSSSFLAMTTTTPTSLPTFASQQSLSPQAFSDISEYQQLTFASVSFVAGLLLVPNIGIGPALTTYLMLALFGFGSKASIVTGIITGGWVSVVPFLIHYFVLADVPLQQWIMVIPGVFLGAQVYICICIVTKHMHPLSD